MISFLRDAVAHNSSSYQQERATPNPLGPDSSTFFAHHFPTDFLQGPPLSFGSFRRTTKARLARSSAETIWTAMLTPVNKEVPQWRRAFEPTLMSQMANVCRFTVTKVSLDSAMVYVLSKLIVAALLCWQGRGILP